MAVNPPLGNLQLAGLLSPPPLPPLPSVPLLRWVVVSGWAGGRPQRSSNILSQNPLPVGSSRNRLENPKQLSGADACCLQGFKYPTNTASPP